MSTDGPRHLRRLASRLREHGRLAIAVSGGVDSLTLAAAAHRTPGVTAEMFHAVSPAVPAAATARVRRLAAREGWHLRLLDAGEMRDPRYVGNPVDRCYFCKGLLYRAIAGLSPWRPASGANLDDLDDYRPGLKAAAEHGVAHPFIEAGLDKAAVRAVARHLGLGAIAELPASPCLSSRVETGLPIDPALLAAIDRAETVLRAVVPAATVRCRVRARGIEVEVDRAVLARWSPRDRDEIRRRVAAALGPAAAAGVSLAPYRRGSAFVGDKTP